MKFEMESVEIQSSGVISESQFGIADMGFILHLLRNKIYSDIKKAICQEYTCNARDAHREAGKGDVPIEITLPTHLEPNFRVRDFGNSISPENMVKVFIQYGASTKRTSNHFTGGFGIGCKTAFGYTDAFIVNTFINGIQRSYSCVIDDTRCGKLALLNESATSAPNGTEIVVPVETQDISWFHRETHKACRHWDVKPVVRGGIIEWNDFHSGNIILEGTEWFVVRDRNGQRDVKLVVDGVEYPGNIENMGIENPLRFGYGTTLYLKFPVGVISVSANREQVENDEATKKAILKQLNVVKSELAKRFEDAIKDSKTFLEANLALHKITSNLNMDMPKDLKWNNVTLFGKGVNLDSGSLVTYSRTTKGAKKDSKYASSQLEFAENTLYCTTELDFNKNVESGAAAVFRAFPAINNICMIRFNDDKEIIKKNLNLLELVKLSDHYTVKSRKSSLGRLMFFKLNDSGVFSRSSLKEYEEDKNKKFWCSIRKETGYDRPSNGMIVKFGTNNLRNNEGLAALTAAVAGIDAVSLYGFSDEIPQDRLEEATEEMENLEEYVNAYIKSENIDIAEVKFALSVVHNNRNNYFLFEAKEEKKILDKIGEIKNQSSSLVTYLQASSEISKKVSKLAKYAFMTFGNNSLAEKNFTGNLKQLCEDATKEYPLFKYMTYQKQDRYSSYYHRSVTVEVAELIEYVNAVDTAAGKV